MIRPRCGTVQQIICPLLQKVVPTVPRLALAAGSHITRKPPALRSPCASLRAGDDGLRAALETAFLFIQEPHWTQDGLERAKQRWQTVFRSNQLSLEKGTTERAFRAMFGVERCVLRPAARITAGPRVLLAALSVPWPLCAAL